MNADRYTKVVLTIIAACLVLLVLERYEIVQTAHAKDVQLVKIDGLDTYYGSLGVYVTGGSVSCN